jgi:hypothetical protein
MTPAEASARLRPLFDLAAAHAVRYLLEEKHLYQSIYLDSVVDGLPEEIWTKVPSPYGDSVRSDFLSLYVLRPWAPICPASLASASSAVTTGAGIRFELPTAKVYCTPCDRLEAYNPVISLEAYRDPRAKATEALQDLVVGYQCQSCKKAPEVFLIHREGSKITLSGRTPIEHVSVPSFIPKRERRYYSDAIVACNSGQVLAGLFLLRTFIEQFVRRVVPNPPDLADLVLEKYMSSLPASFKSQFPSLRDHYGRLSSAIHRANPSGELFTESVKAIDMHFDARRLFALPDVTPTESK